jgi:adenosylhomocysteine nucleosidase
MVKAFALEPGSINGAAVHTGTVGNADVIATTTGMGTALATRATERLLGLGEFDRVVVVGIAGGVGPSVGIGDVVIPQVVVDGTTGTPYQPAPIDAPTARGTIVTSDDFIIDPARLDALIAEGVIAVDMETGSVAAACAARGVPWSAVRAISDRAEEGHGDSRTRDSDGTPNARRSSSTRATPAGSHMLKVRRARPCASSKPTCGRGSAPPPSGSGPQGQARQPTMSRAITGPAGGSPRYCSYLSRNAASAPSCSAPGSSTRPTVSRRIHHTVVQSSS